MGWELIRIYCSDSKSITDFSYRFDSLLILLSYLTGTALRVTIILKTYMYKLTPYYMVKYVCILKIFLLFDVASVRVVTQKRLWMLWGCPS